MPLAPDIETDLRYLQDGDMQFAGFELWQQASNPFERKMAANLRPGMPLNLDLPTLRRFLGAAVVGHGLVVTVDLFLQPGRVHTQVVSADSAAVPPISADNCCNFLYALEWFLRHGESRLRLSVCADSFFWIHAIGGVGTHCLA